MHKRQVLNLPRGRAIDLAKVTFLTFSAFFQIFPISSKTTRSDSLLKTFYQSVTNECISFSFTFLRRKDAIDLRNLKF